jgi:hypothetical protein
VRVRVQKGGQNSQEVRGGAASSNGLAQDVLTSVLCTGRASKGVANRTFAVLAFDSPVNFPGLF